MTRRILMVAYHFPPLAGSSGIQRTLRFAQHLPTFGWQPLILSASPKAYEQTNTDLSRDIAPGTVVRRAFALDTARHLAIKGRYLSALARPDRWVSWKFDGIRQGMKMIKELKPDVIWSTYPIATAHLIGAELHRRSGLPWVADFRDPMAQDGYPADPLTWQQYKKIEAHTLKAADITSFTTPGAAAEYRLRYPGSAERIHVVENGYDEETFAAADPFDVKLAPPFTAGAITLLHSGVVYPSERDPTHLMAALQLLTENGNLQPGQLKIRFRAAVAEDLLRTLAAKFKVEAYIEICPPVPYRMALAEMMAADGLLILQASNCNEQIPAKLYEYLRAGRPIIALTDPIGDTATVLRTSGINSISPLDNAGEIARLLKSVVFKQQNGLQSVASAAAIHDSSRLNRTKELATLLSQLLNK